MSRVTKMTPKPAARHDWPFRVYILTPFGEACCGYFPDLFRADSYVRCQRIAEALIGERVKAFTMIIRERRGERWIEVGRSEPNPYPLPTPSPATDQTIPQEK